MPAPKLVQRSLVRSACFRCSKLVASSAHSWIDVGVRCIASLSIKNGLAEPSCERCGFYRLRRRPGGRAAPSRSRGRRPPSADRGDARPVALHAVWLPALTGSGTASDRRVPHPAPRRFVPASVADAPSPSSNRGTAVSVPPRGRRAFHRRGDVFSPMRPATKRATRGPTISTANKRAVWTAMTNDTSTAGVEAAMTATESTPPGLVAR